MCMTGSILHISTISWTLWPLLLSLFYEHVFSKVVLATTLPPFHSSFVNWSISISILYFVPIIFVYCYITEHSTTTIWSCWWWEELEWWWRIKLEWCCSWNATATTINYYPAAWNITITFTVIVKTFYFVVRIFYLADYPRYYLCNFVIRLTCNFFLLNIVYFWVL